MTDGPFRPVAILAQGGVLGNGTGAFIPGLNLVNWPPSARTRWLARAIPSGVPSSLPTASDQYCVRKGTAMPNEQEQRDAQRRGRSRHRSRERLASPSASDEDQANRIAQERGAEFRAQRHREAIRERQRHDAQRKLDKQRVLRQPLGVYTNKDGRQQLRDRGGRFTKAPKKEVQPEGWEKLQLPEQQSLTPGLTTTGTDQARATSSEPGSISAVSSGDRTFETLPGLSDWTHPSPGANPFQCLNGLHSIPTMKMMDCLPRLRRRMTIACQVQ